MRIQHNIMKINAYRNYNTNTSALSKNLEKLSSGYKINRAGTASKAFSAGVVTGTMADGSKTTTATKAEFVVDYSNLTNLEPNKGYKIGTVEKTIAAATAEGLAAAFDNVEVTIDGNAYIASDAGGGKIKFTAKDAGALTAETDATNAGVSVGTVTAPGAAPTGTPQFVANSNVDGADAGTPIAAKTEIELKDVTYDNAIGSTLTIGDKTYEFVKAGEDVTTENAVKVELADAATNDDIIDALNTAVGTDTTITAKFTVAKDGTKLTFTEKATTPTGTEKAVVVSGTGFKGTGADTTAATGLQLQIGDTADGFNQLFVEIGDMHTDAMDISDINIGDQQGAAAAITKIKDAINYVSAVRGDLGAYQNRLEHTANNLSVMAENIQDAESTIRDTDVAEEMMAYTKNNILIQSAQAMLAQANQVPQGVLQLLG